MITPVLYAAALVLGAEISLEGDIARGYTRWLADSATLPQAQVETVTGRWQLQWDDDVGQELVDDVKTCELSLKAIDNVVTGEFVGPVAGSERQAILEGHIHGDDAGSLFTFTQREAGYVCSYQIFWSNADLDRSEVVGVWHDTRGRSGNFTL
ncbi:MAG: hypothetical protein AAF589_02885 [Planctomycetota bacterium]